MYNLSDALNENGLNVRAAVSSVLRLPTSTMPWWHAGRMLNQNRGVFGLNLLELVAAGGRHGQDHRTAPCRSGSGPPGASGRKGLPPSNAQATLTDSSLSVATSARWSSPRAEPTS